MRKDCMDRRLRIIAARRFSVTSFSRADGFATIGRQEFGVPQAADAICSIEDDRSSDDRSEQRTTADFIDTGNQSRARIPRFLLEAQCATQTLQQAQLGGRS